MSIIWEDTKKITVYVSSRQIWKSTEYIIDNFYNTNYNNVIIEEQYELSNYLPSNEEDSKKIVILKSKVN
jgi:hypothetical protein